VIFLYDDCLYRSGGIETYAHALALHLHEEGIEFCLAVSEVENCPILDELIARGIRVYRQRRVRGDTWGIQKKLLMWWVLRRLRKGDWVYCLRQPRAYLALARGVHRRQAKLAVSWLVAPEFLAPSDKETCQAVAETDAVISVSRCTVHQFREVYGWEGSVQVVPYHNLPFFAEPLPLPPGPPWKIGYMGRVDIEQKNLDQLLAAFGRLAYERADVELHFHGRGPGQPALEKQADDLGIRDRVFLHGAYDHRRDLPSILASCHIFTYASRLEGGPCFSLLEIMQAGRFCVASPVGGIPDLYEGYPEVGTLVAHDDVSALSRALGDAVARAAAGRIDGKKIHARYHEGFDMAAAHRAWLAALGLDARGRAEPAP
jgi:glycosyltransferase involved in cell wall biosynthesis